MPLSQNDLKIPLIIDPQLQLFNAAMKKVESGLNKAGFGIGAAVGTAVTATVSPPAFASTLRDLQGPLSAFSAVLDKIPGFGGTLNSILGSLTQMAGVANPEILTRLNIVTEDVQGVIGKAFMPVLEAMIPVLREVGNAIAEALTPSIMAPMIDAVKDLGSAMVDVFGNQALWQVAIAFVTGLTYMGAAILKVVNIIVKSVGWLLKLLGLLPDEDLRNLGASSVGAAARRANYQSVESYQQQLQAAAYSGAGADAQTRTANATEEIVRLMRDQARERGQGAPGNNAIERIMEGGGR